MPTTGANQTAYMTRVQLYEAVQLANPTAINTISLVTSGGTNGSAITDILFRSADGSARNFNIIIAPTGDQAVSANNRVQVSIPANSGNNGSTIIASLATLVPQLFDIDLAGNRILVLEPGTSIYVQNTTATAGIITITVKKRDY